MKLSIEEQVICWQNIGSCRKCPLKADEVGCCKANMSEEEWEKHESIDHDGTER